MEEKLLNRADRINIFAESQGLGFLPPSSSSTTNQSNRTNYGYEYDYDDEDNDLDDSIQEDLYLLDKYKNPSVIERGGVSSANRGGSEDDATLDDIEYGSGMLLPISTIIFPSKYRIHRKVVYTLTSFLVSTIIISFFYLLTNEKYVNIIFIWNLLLTIEIIFHTIMLLYVYMKSFTRYSKQVLLEKWMQGIFIFPTYTKTTTNTGIDINNTIHQSTINFKESRNPQEDNNNQKSMTQKNTKRLKIKRNIDIVIRLHDPVLYLAKLKFPIVAYFLRFYVGLFYDKDGNGGIMSQSHRQEYDYLRNSNNNHTNNLFSFPQKEYSFSSNDIKSLYITQQYSYLFCQKIDCLIIVGYSEGRIQTAKIYSYEMVHSLQYILNFLQDENATSPSHELKIALAKDESIKQINNVNNFVKEVVGNQNQNKTGTNNFGVDTAIELGEYTAKNDDKNQGVNIKETKGSAENNLRGKEINSSKKQKKVQQEEKMYPVLQEKQTHENSQVEDKKGVNQNSTLTSVDDPSTKLSFNESRLNNINSNNNSVMGNFDQSNTNEPQTPLLKLNNNLTSVSYSDSNLDIDYNIFTDLNVSNGLGSDFQNITGSSRGTASVDNIASLTTDLLSAPTSTSLSVDETDSFLQEIDDLLNS